ncbi:holin family protein [Pseudooceanicola algae]|uniref:Holin of 3TMs, for gene-transfer release n=1 Tax=Pseudooceanicola algae TaxID=1537215 RepID=A0A418SFH8_9RHOB|nr:holin family protein [Pseudooceanicola algae]QPM89853.1 hypothetical protein PSAL_010820 [Pseudooceanicola algae]
MGMIDTGLNALLGQGGNVIRSTAEVFRPNAEAAAQRDHEMLANALQQFSAEFRDQRSGFDRVMDALNRLPRPAMAFGAIGLMVAAMSDPIWFAARMQGLALVPEALWWLLGAVVSFYFGARHQVKGQQFQRELARNLTMAPQVAGNMRDLHALREGPELSADQTPVGPISEGPADPNPALEAWRART